MYLGKKISVAMATYNGEKYLKEQLDSILKQCRHCADSMDIFSGNRVSVKIVGHKHV